MLKNVSFSKFFPMCLYHSLGNLRIEKKKKVDFVSPVWEASGLCLVTKKVKDYSSKSMFVKSTTVNKRLDQKR